MTRRLARIAASAAFALLSAAAQGQPAPTPSHLALATEVAVGSGITRSFNTITDGVIESLNEMQIAQPDIKKDVDSVIAVLRPELELQKRRMVANAAAAFAKHMSEAELKEVVGFFKSPAGRKYVERQPPVFDDIMASMQVWTKEVQDYALIRAKAEMAKRGRELQ